MKLLKVRASGIPLFQTCCEIDFLALQRVTEENAEKMSCTFHAGPQGFYQNNVLSIVGINASGKTTLLKLIAFVCRMLNNEPLNGIDCADILDGLAEGSRATIETFFFAHNRETYPWSEEGAVNFLQTVVTKQGGKLVIAYETLKSKTLSKVKSKKTLFDFNGIEINLSRNIRENAEFLLDDVSIMVAFNKRNREHVPFTELLRYTNINALTIKEDCPPQLIAFFDPSVAYLKVESKSKGLDIRLKFNGQDELQLKQLSELDRYLSSGTIKGINVFLKAMETFQTGGYLIVDELENHFNREIVSTLIRFFMDKKVNPRGAMLIFSTHYPELLDEFERNDNIYVARHQQGITVENLSNLLKRNDVKKSDAYQSGLLEGTVPMYEAFMDLKRSIMQTHQEGV